MNLHVHTLTPAQLLDMVDRSTHRMITSVRKLDDRDVRAPSRLPGWTRGHVLTHVARNADALGNLLTWASTGVETPMYPSREQRNADIEAGAARPAPDHLADLEASHRRFSDKAAAMTGQGWSGPIRYGARNMPANGGWVPMLRMGELEIHHTDLAVDYTPEQWPPAWVAVFLPSAIDDLDQRAGEPLGLLASDTGARLGSSRPDVRVVRGPQALLLAWVTGRSSGHGLTGGPLPQLGDWR